MIKRKAKINSTECVACGSCVKVCPKSAIRIVKGVYAEVSTDLCVGCGLCSKTCPASVINMEVLSNE